MEKGAQDGGTMQQVKFLKTPLEEEVEDWSGDTPSSLIGPGHNQSDECWYNPVLHRDLLKGRNNGI